MRGNFPPLELGLDKIQISSLHHRLRPVGNSQLSADIVHMRLYGSRAEIQLLGDLPVRQSHRNQAQDFKFPLAELFDLAGGGCLNGFIPADAGQYALDVLRVHPSPGCL